jgi:hypothetical protein
MSAEKIFCVLVTFYFGSCERNNIWVSLKDGKIVDKVNDCQLLQKKPYCVQFFSYLLRCSVISHFGQPNCGSVINIITLLHTYPEERSSRCLRNVGNDLPNCKVAQLRRSQSKKLFDVFQRERCHILHDLSVRVFFNGFLYFACRYTIDIH